jgi:hypothetical protein
MTVQYGQVINDVGGSKRTALPGEYLNLKRASRNLQALYISTTWHRRRCQEDSLDAVPHFVISRGLWSGYVHVTYDVHASAEVGSKALLGPISQVRTTCLCFWKCCLGLEVAMDVRGTGQIYNYPSQRLHGYVVDVHTPRCVVCVVLCTQGMAVVWSDCSTGHRWSRASEIVHQGVAATLLIPGGSPRRCILHLPHNFQLCGATHNCSQV